MINKQVTKEHILYALESIDMDGVPTNRHATKYNLYHKGKTYPPKYVLSIATKFAVGRELESSEFSGGRETNKFLSNIGFNIREGNKTIHSDTRRLHSKKPINICTAIIQTKDSFKDWDNTDNNKKIELLTGILNELNRNTDILILPAGFLNSNNKKPETIYKKTEKTISELIRKKVSNLFICLGIDGTNKKDQIALAISKSGIVAIGRKFIHPDKSSRNLAETPFTLENNMPRHFLIKDKLAYMAVCYDIYGISQEELKNENNYNFIIGSIHGFDKGGDVDFARKGLAGASRQWNVHSYASAVFANNRNATNWPSGVKWTHGKRSVKDYTYEEIRIDSKLKTMDTKTGAIFLRYYNE